MSRGADRVVSEQNAPGIADDLYQPPDSAQYNHERKSQKVTMHNTQHVHYSVFATDFGNPASKGLNPTVGNKTSMATQKAMQALGLKSSKTERRNNSMH